MVLGLDRLQPPVQYSLNQLVMEVLATKKDEKSIIDVLDFFAIKAEHQVLKYAAGKQMFCPVPKCGCILDYRKTVIITGSDDKPFILCSDCFDLPQVQEALSKAGDQIKEITKYRTNLIIKK